MAYKRNRTRANRRAQNRTATNLRRYNARRRLTRPCVVAMERVVVPDETHNANELSQPLLPQPTQGLSGPICRASIVRHEVETEWPIGHKLFYKCRFQVSI